MENVKVNEEELEKDGLFSPVNDLVLVKPVAPKDRETPSGIIIPLDVLDQENLVSNQEGIVIGVGPGSEDRMQDFSIDMDIKAGDSVVYEKGKGIPVSFNNKDYDYVRGWNIIGKLIDETVPDMPFIWQGRTLQPFGNRIFIKRIDVSATINGIALPERSRCRSPKGKIITMGPDMPKHFKKHGIEPGKLIIFDPLARQMALHQWRHNDMMFCIIEANDILCEPLTPVQLKKLNYQGESW